MNGNSGNTNHFANLTDEQLAATRQGLLDAIVAISDRGESIGELPQVLQRVIDEQLRRAGRL
jgi:hypothetical protein